MINFSIEIASANSGDKMTQRGCSMAIPTMDDLYDRWRRTADEAERTGLLSADFKDIERITAEDHITLIKRRLKKDEFTPKVIQVLDEAMSDPERKNLDQKQQRRIKRISKHFDDRHLKFYNKAKELRDALFARRPRNLRDLAMQVDASLDTDPDFDPPYTDDREGTDQTTRVVIAAIRAALPDFEFSTPKRMGYTQDCTMPLD